MKRNKILFKIFRYSGIPFLFREIIQKNKVTILLFHDIDKTAAEQTFSYLSKNYNIICLNDFITALKQKTKVPKKALIITFDDGCLRNFDIFNVIFCKSVRKSYERHTH